MTRIRAQIAPAVTCIDCLSLSLDRHVETFESIDVNQGFAIKTKNVGYAEHNYPIDRPIARQVWNQFTVKPRGQGQTVNVPVLERHPYTTQSFIPLSVASHDYAYLVVVAADRSGAPDVSTLKAWFCRGNQMVTYAKNQWHAPMIALHEMLQFVVTNAENGTSDDLQEHFFSAEETPSVEIGHLNTESKKARL